MSVKTVTELSDATFKQEVLESDVPVLVDFWAPWCGPCRVLAPRIEALAEEYEGKVKVAKMNIDDNASTPVEYGVAAIPTVILFSKGKKVQEFVGVQATENYKKAIEQIAG